MKGIDIELKQDEFGLIINNLEQSKGVEFRFVKYKTKKRIMSESESIGSVLLSYETFEELTKYFNERVESYNAKKPKKEFAECQFFANRDERKKETSAKKGAKKK